MRAILICLLAACGPSHKTGGDDVDAPQGCTMDVDCGQDQHCDAATHTCLGGCGGQHLDLTYVPPNLEIVLDRSCSMTQKLSGSNTTKWEAVVAALDHVLGSYAADVRWGMTMFPDISGANCTQDAIPYPVADNNAPAIQTQLQSSLSVADPYYPDSPCVTNIDTGVEQAATDPALALTDRPSFLMLATDGAQSSCNAGGGDAGTEAAIGNLFTQHHIATFVVGFGSQVDDAELTKLANLGGVPSGGAKPYYQADTAAQIDAVFQQIASQVVSCTYKVAQTPPSLDETYVIYSGSTLVPRDITHVAGWDYDPATMELTVYGTYCDQLKTHVVTSVDVVFGCPTPPIL